ncbi:4'-phosphopantetheinyl transferase [Kitasatospora sp. NPDC088134]|uniref:4'-phosphopantetheinyl transferase family protein n=1 Tax=Kitasatospora sp. NPDC088134 TaxID=3364071 RepID=UPI0037FD123F
MIEHLLPANVATAWTTHDEAKADLFPEEETCLRHAVASRRREFATGRRCARQALAALGLPPGPLPGGERGEPGWPPGTVGSITHCRGYRAAAAARSAEYRSVGIDAEEHRPLPPDLPAAVLLPAERAAAARLAAERPGTHWETVMFSAKESVYKAWFPLARTWLGFHDAELRIDPSGTFSARLLVPGPVVDGMPLREFSGCWSRHRQVVLTAVLHAASPQLAVG